MTNKVLVPARQSTYAGGIVSLESIPGLLKRLQIRALWSLFIFTYLLTSSMTDGSRSTNMERGTYFPLPTRSIACLFLDYLYKNKAFVNGMTA